MNFVLKSTKNSVPGFSLEKYIFRAEKHVSMERMVFKRINDTYTKGSDFGNLWATSSIFENAVLNSSGLYHSKVFHFVVT